MENYFKKGYLLVIVCTSTLSSGINFPARRVIIRTPMFNGKPIDAMNYKQMVGRAGRKGIDTIGESIVMCSNLAEKRIAQSLVKAKLTEINVPILNEEHLLPSIKRALLETIVSGIASKKHEIIEYTNCFLKFKSSQDGSNMSEKYLKWLNMNQFIDIVAIHEKSDEEEISTELYKPTQLGYAVVASAMSPDEGLVIFSELQKALQCFVLENELHIIYQITPMNICSYWANSSSSIDWNLYYTMLQNFTPDIKRVADLVGVRQSFLLKMIKGSANLDAKLHNIHLRFYTALILNDLVNEVPFATLLNKYGCQKGFLQSLQQSSATYAHMIHLFCNRLGWFNLEILVENFQSRLTFGVQRQLLDLVRIELLNSHRARLFYNSGLTTVASIAMADLKKIERILRSGVQFAGKRVESENEQNCCDSAIWHDGKGYTYWEAASAILQKANELLRVDLEQLGVKVNIDNLKNETENTNELNKFVVKFNDTCNTTIHSQNKTKMELENSCKETLSEINENETSLKDCKSLEEKERTQNESVKRNPSPKETIHENCQVTTIDKNHLTEKALNMIDNIMATKTLLGSQKVSIQIKETPRSSKKIQFLDDQLKENSCPYSLQYEINSLQGLILESQMETNKKVSQIIVESKNIEIEDSFEEDKIVVDNNEQNTTETLDLPVNEKLNSDIEKMQSSASFFDDQCMLQAAEIFEKVTDDKKSSCQRKSKIDTTLVSEDILQMCDIFEKNVLSSKKKPKTPNDQMKKSKNLNKSIAKNLFGDETLKKLMEDSIIEPKNASESVISVTNSRPAFNRNQVLANLEKLNLNVRINLVETKDEYENFLNKIKPKSSFSLGFACEFYEKESLDLNTEEFFTEFNHEMNSVIKFCGVSLCLDTDKQKVINFLLFKKDKLFQGYLKRLLELEDFTKLVFFAKEHCKLVYNLFKINLKMGAYDPLVGDWLMNQEFHTIYQIKQKYCPSLSIGIDPMLRNSKQCYGCCSNHAPTDSAIDTIQKSLTESLICIYSFEKIRLQLQLQNLWIYFAKIESEIVLISAKVEIAGLGLCLNEMNKNKETLMKFKKEIEENVFFITGREINMNSSNDIASVIYDELKLKPNIESTGNLVKFKHHSTSKGALEQLGKQHQLPRLIILWRKVTHTISNSLYPIERVNQTI